MIVFVFLIIVLLVGVVIDTKEVNEIYSIYSVLVLSIIVIIYTIKSQKRFTTVLISAFLIRCVVLLVDYYKVFPIIGSGSDTEFFYQISVSKALGKPVDYLTNYTVFLTYLFKLIGPQRLFAQFINVLCSYGTIIYIIKAIELAGVKKSRTLLPYVLIASFTPQVIFFSGILLRESLITFFLSISVFYCLKYLQTRRVSYFIFVMCSIFVCTFLHTGMIMGVLGFPIVVMLYDKRRAKLSLSVKRIVSVVLLVFILSVIISTTDMFTGYIDSIIKGEDADQAMLDRLNYEINAGSAYLTSLKFDSSSSIFMFLPLKIFYFLFSPMPWDFRNMLDAITFLFDSSIFIYMFYLVFFNKKNAVSSSLILVFFLLTMLYALGTTTAGTAIRHRDTILPVLIVAAAYSSMHLSLKLK